MEFNEWWLAERAPARVAAPETLEIVVEALAQLQELRRLVPTLELGQLIGSTDISQYCFPVHF